MRGDFENDLDWFALVAAFAIWSGHFMLVWSVSSIFPGEPVVLWLTLALTVVALTLLAWLWRARRVRTVRSVAGLSIAIATMATLYDFLPALMAR